MPSKHSHQEFSYAAYDDSNKFVQLCVSEYGPSMSGDEMRKLSQFYLSHPRGWTGPKGSSTASEPTSSYKGAISGELNFSNLVREGIRGQTMDKGGDPLEFMKIEEGLELVWDFAKNKAKSLEEIATGMINVGAQGLILYYSQQAKLQAKINESTSLTGQMSKDFRDTIMESSIYANRLGISFKDISDGMVELIRSSGRFKLINEETINKISLTSKVFFDSYREGVLSIEEFQKVSRGASDSMEAIEKMGKSSLGLGLNAKTTVKDMVTNIDKLNQFGFKNGIEGLTRMVQKAQMLRMDLNNAFKIAEEVMDPTKALEMAANLQVIGGAVDAFNDPIRMMWMATNDAEGLQDALIKSAESLVSFNQESETFEIVGADLRRARAMADALGMEFKELTNLAVQSAQRTSAAADLMSTGLILDDEDREFLTNISQMKDGRMVIEAKDERGNAIEIALDSMTKTQADYLLSQKQQFEEMDQMDIARQQVSLIENMERDISFLAATARAEAAKELQGMALDFGYDPNKYEKMMRDFTTEAQLDVINSIYGSTEGLSKSIQDAYKKMDEADRNNTTSQSTNTPQTIHHTHSSDVATDQMARQIMGNPAIESRIIDGEGQYTVINGNVSSVNPRA